MAGHDAWAGSGRYVGVMPKTLEDITLPRPHAGAESAGSKAPSKLRRRPSTFVDLRGFGVLASIKFAGATA